MRPVLILFALLLSACLAPAWAQAPVPASASPATKACVACHEKEQPDHFGTPEHKINAYHGECLSCHTPDPTHLTMGGENVSFPDAGTCLSCHKKGTPKLMHWAFAAHNKANVNCRDCHGIHVDKKPAAGNLGMWKMDKKSTTCVNCHQDVAARLNMASHHPVKEGALSCTSCHDPHGSKQTTLLGKNDQCFKCHQAIRGPKVFEHAPVAEDCTICHNPHGTPNRRLLTASQPMQCLQCHALVDSRHTQGGTLRGAVLRNCTSCHAAIHGSHIDPKLKH